MGNTNYGQYLRNFDAFGRHVGLAIDGEDTYKTYCGALATMSIIFLVITGLAIMIAQPLTYEFKASLNSGFTSSSSNNFSEGDVGNVTINGIDYTGTHSTRISNIHRTAAFDSKSYYPQNDGFMFAVDFQDNYQNSSEMFFEFYIYSKELNGSFSSIQYLPSIPCTPDLFPSIPNEELEKYHINDHFLCPNLTDLNFVSDNYGDTYKYISVDALACYENITGFNCADIDEIDFSFTGDRMRIFTVEGYYDSADQDNPVKHKLNNEITIPITFGFQSQKDFRLKQNQVKKLDGDIVNFTSIEEKDTLTFGLSSFYIAICYFELANNYDYYEKYVDYQPRSNPTRNQNVASNEEKLMSNEYFVFFIMAQMGGLFTFFFLLFGAFVNYYNKHALYHTTIKKLNRLNKEHQTSTKYRYKNLLYKVFCCNRSNPNGPHRSLARRNAEFNKELQKYNEDRDIVNITNSMNNMKLQIGDIKANTESIQVMHQAIPDQKLDKCLENQEKENNNCFSSEFSKTNESLNKRENKDSSNLNKLNVGKDLHEEHKILFYGGKYNKNTTAVQNINQSILQDKIYPLRKISDKINQKDTNPKDSIKQTYQTPTNQVQIIKDTSVQNYNRNGRNDILGIRNSSLNGRFPLNGRLFSCRRQDINKNQLNIKPLKTFNPKSPRHTSHPPYNATSPDNKNQVETETNILKIDPNNYDY